MLMTVEVVDTVATVLAGVVVAGVVVTEEPFGAGLVVEVVDTVATPEVGGGGGAGA